MHEQREEFSLFAVEIPTCVTPLRVGSLLGFCCPLPRLPGHEEYLSWRRISSDGMLREGKVGEW